MYCHDSIDHGDRRIKAMNYVDVLKKYWKSSFNVMEMKSLLSNNIINKCIIIINQCVNLCRYLNIIWPHLVDIIEVRNKLI